MNLKRLACQATAVLALAQPAYGRPVTATVYHQWYEGRVTACGSVYRDSVVSAAHPWLPCGTLLRVEHKGRVLTVPVKDRCNCDSLDLSYAAARRLGVPTDGTATVHIQEL